MTADTFDPMADAAASYFFARKMMRLRGIITGEFWPQPEEEFDMIAAADLARLADRQRERVTG